jgi:hypothetical protein
MKIIQIVNDLLVRKWLLIIFFSLGGAVIGASIAYLFPLPKVVSETYIRLTKGEDQNEALFQILTTLPKCATNLVQSNEDVLTQVISKVKASHRDLRVSVMGGNVDAVEKCLQKSVDFILKPKTERSSLMIDMLEKEIFVIDKILSFVNKNITAIKVGEHSNFPYPQELLLRKFRNLQEIDIIKNNGSYAWNYSTHLNSTIPLIALRFCIGALVGFLLGFLVVIFTCKSFDKFFIPKS